MLNNFEKECIAQSRKVRLSAAKKKLAKKGEDYNDKQRIKDEIKKLETEPLPTQEPDEKVLSALWSLYGLKGEEYSDDERMGLLAVWIEILYGKEVLEDLRLESKVKKIIARQKRLNEPHCSENKSKSHLAGKNTIDALIYKISESLPEYESDGLVWAETLGLEPWAESDSKDEGDSEDCKSEDDSENRNENESEVKSENRIGDNSDRLDEEGINSFKIFNAKIVAVGVLLLIGALFLFCTNAPESKEQPKIQANNYVKPSYVEPSYQETVQVFYQKPPAGEGYTLSSVELRWCVRESYRIDILEEWISETNELNGLKADFNSRCGNAVYYQEDLDVATREVDAKYDEIHADAIAYAKRILQAYQYQQSPRVETSPEAPPTPKKVKPAHIKQSPNIFTKGSPKQLVIKLQGKPDSVTPHHTYEILHYGYNFVKVSSKDHKVLSWCNTNGDLKVNSAKKPKQKKRQRPLNTFTQGSPRQLVIKLQGCYPDAVTMHPTYEILHYGHSVVKVSLKDLKVLSWCNVDGNLKVKK